MSLLFDSWGRKHKVTVQASQVLADVTGLSVAVSRAHLHDSVVDPSGADSARVDGGDIRFSSDSLGDVPLPCDVVEFEHDSATGASDAVIKIIVKLDVLQGSDVDFWVWFARPASTQPVPSDAIGAHNAYDANHIAMHPGVFGSEVSATSLWLNDPKAATHNGATYYTWLDSVNSLIKISKYTHATGVWETEQTVGTSTGVDAHQAPTILVDSAGIIWVFFGDYNNFTPSRVLYCTSSAAEDISSWSARTVAVSGTRCTYPSALQLSTGEILLYYRDGTTATDIRRIVWNGTSWVDDQRIILSAGADRPYYQVVLGANDRVHIAYHWYSGNHRDLYYVYSDNAAAANSSWASADGTALAMPLAQSATQLVFNSDILWDTGYLGGISIGAANQPHIAFSVTDASNTNKLIHYTYTGGSWVANDIIVDNGVEVTGYAAGVIDCDINADDNNNIQCIFCLDVGGVYEVQEYSTVNGSAWSLLRNVTENSTRHNRLVGYTKPLANECRAVWQYSATLHYNTGYGDHHFLSSNNLYQASWVDFLTKTASISRDRTRNHNDTVATGSPVEVPGALGTAFDFDGSTDYFSAGMTYPTNEGITLTCLFNTDNAGLNQNTIGLGNNGSSGHFRQLITTGGRLRVQKQNDGSIVAQEDTTNAVSANIWHHAATVFTGDTGRSTYLDMLLAGAGHNADPISDPTVDFLAFGALRRGSIAQRVNGRLEHTRVADTAYSEDRLTTEKNNLLSPTGFMLFGAPIAANAVTQVFVSSLDAALARQGILASFSADSLLKTPTVAGAVADAALQAQASATAGIDAKLKQVGTLATALSGALRSGMATEASLDSIISTSGSSGLSLGSALRAPMAVAPTADAALLRQAVIAALATDSTLVSAAGSAAAVDAALQSVAETAASDIDATLLGIRVATAQLGAVLISSGASTVTALDAAARSALDAALAMDAALRRRTAAPASVDATLALTGLLAVALDSVLIDAFAVVIALDSQLKRQGVSASVGMGAILSGGLTTGCPTATVRLYLASGGSVVLGPTARPLTHTH